MYYLDTNICVYFMKGKHPQLLSIMMKHEPKDIKIPAIVEAELLYGVEKSVKKEDNYKKLVAFLTPFDIIPFGSKESGVYAAIRASLERKGTPIGPNDMLIAATVIANNGILVTNNVSEFSRVDVLRHEDWTVSDKV